MRLGNSDDDVDSCFLAEVSQVGIVNNIPCWDYPKAGFTLSPFFCGERAGVPKATFGEKYGAFCRLLTEARQGKGLTQLELARRLHRPQSFVSKYEHAERRLDVVEFLEVAHAIGLDPAIFLQTLDKTGPFRTAASHRRKRNPPTR